MSVLKRSWHGPSSTFRLCWQMLMSSLLASQDEYLLVQGPDQETRASWLKNQTHSSFLSQLFHSSHWTQSNYSSLFALHVLENSHSPFSFADCSVLWQQSRDMFELLFFAAFAVLPLLSPNAGGLPSMIANKICHFVAQLSATGPRNLF